MRLIAIDTGGRHRCLADDLEPDDARWLRHNILRDGGALLYDVKPGTKLIIEPEEGDESEASGGDGA